MINDPELSRVMNSIANAISGAMPPGYGFALLCFKFNSTDGDISYISNGNREQVVCALKELVARFEGRAIDEVGGTH